MKPSVLHYKDFRTYLRDFYKHKKYINPQWSYGAWARTLGVNSPSTISMILNGQRFPGSKLIHSFATSCKLTCKETRYFENLVQIQKRVKDPSLSAILIEEFIERNKISNNTELCAAALSKNAHTVIAKELIRLKDFKLDPKWIAERISVPLQIDLYEHINKLIKNELIAKESGKLVYKGEDGASSNTSEELAKKLHHDSIEMLKQSLNFYVDDPSAYNSMMVLNISREKMKEARELLDEFQERFTKIMSKDSGDELIQLNMSMFALTKL